MLIGLRPTTTMLLAMISAVVVCLLNICSVDAIQCYECSSSVQPHCTEEIDVENTNLQLVDCSNVYKAAFCIKTTGIFNGEMGATRFCSSENLGNICDFQKRMGDVRAYRGCIFTCSSDGCNGSSTLVSYRSIVVTLLLAALTWFACSKAC